MKFVIYTFIFPSGEKVYLKANLTQDTAQIFWRVDPTDDWYTTKYISGDARCRISGLTKLVLEMARLDDETHSLDDIDIDDIEAIEGEIIEEPPEQESCAAQD